MPSGAPSSTRPRMRERKLLEFAAPKLGVTPEELDTADGVVFVKANPQKEHEVEGHGKRPDHTRLRPFRARFHHVQLHDELRGGGGRYGDGKGDLLRVVNATDVGQIIDPHGLEGQLNGCLGSAGIDSAIFEETILDRRTGHIVNANLIDYKWRTSAELPVIEHVVLETPFPEPPLSCRRRRRDVDVARTFGGAHGRLQCRRHLAARVPGHADRGYSRPWERREMNAGGAR